MTLRGGSDDRHCVRPPPETGVWDRFRTARDPGDESPRGFRRADRARNIRDEDEIITFGLFEMTKEEYDRWREAANAEENKRVDRPSAFVEDDHLSGVYEVIDILEE